MCVGGRECQGDTLEIGGWGANDVLEVVLS